MELHTLNLVKAKNMAKILKKEITTETEPELHKGYNEKNPSEPQGAFKAAPMEAPPKPVKKSPRKNKKTI